MEDFKRLAQDPRAEVRQQVAGAEDAPPELLYFLASDKEGLVRQAVAENLSTPVQALPLQAADDEAYVRAALARKIGRILPQMGDGANRQTVFKAIERLMADKAESVRVALSLSLQDIAFLPPSYAVPLACDTAQAVGSPLLRFSLALPEAELIRLVEQNVRPWMAFEIAHRKDISNDLAMAIWQSGDSEAAAVLLGNRSSETPPAVLEEAVEDAPIITILQPPLVQHPDLSPQQMQRLADCVEGSMLSTLAARAAADQGTLSDVTAIVTRRLAWAVERQKGEKAAARAKKLYAAGQLGDAALADAVAYGEKDFVIAALALLARTEEVIVGKIISHQSPKGITALCWQAGLSMRTARQVQIKIARVPPIKALYARGGIDYPMNLQDINWQLEFYGVL